MIKSNYRLQLFPADASRLPFQILIFCSICDIILVFLTHTGVILINIGGNLESLRESALNEIEGLYDLEISRDEFLPEELALKLAELTGRINREIAVYMNRKGNIVSVNVGDSGTVSLPAVEGRRGKHRLAGIRCFHTHPNGEGRLSPVDINSLLSLKLDAMVALGTRDGKITEIYAAVPSAEQNNDSSNAEIFGPYKLDDRKLNLLLELIRERDKLSGDSIHVNEDRLERAILVGLETIRGNVINGKTEGERLLDELEELALTAGVVVVQKILQRKPVKDPAYLIGRGKVEELCLLRQAVNADVVIFDDELSGAQFRNIEELVGVKVVDRTTLILDIFAQRARSREGKLQVELAQLKYRLPRLIGLGNQLSRLGGGIGTRGPGEKKLEVDRRHIRRRINFLEAELKEISKRRGFIREGRKKNSIPAVALVGYTNAGKSTLMNRLCGTDVFAENKLFATLDPTARRLPLPDGREALLIDTVGFIRKLPHDLVEAFKSTLEETVNADVLMHVADASDEEAQIQIKVVEDLLKELGAFNKPVVLVLNKMDLMDRQFRIPVGEYDGKAFEVSAVTGKGVEDLVKGLASILPIEEVEVNVLVPYNAGWISSYVHENGRVLETDYTEEGTKIKALIRKNTVERIKEYVC